MNVRVVNFRKGPFGTVLGFFDLVIEDTFVARGNALKKAESGKYYFQPKGILRVDKNGDPVQNEKGFNIYDNIFDLYTTKQEDGSYKPTPAGWDAREEILAQAVALLEGDGEGRGPAKGKTSSAKKTTVKAGATKPAAATESVEDADDFGDEDDLPF